MTDEIEEAPDLGKVPNSIVVYACPSCGNWYGSNLTPDLSQVVNRRTSMRNAADEDPSRWGEVTGTRIECGHCRDGTKRLLVEFVRRDVVIRAIEDGIEGLYQEEEKKSGLKLSRPQ